MGQKYGSGRLLADAPLNSVLHQFSGAAQRQLFLDMRLVRLHGLHTDVQFFRDLTRRVPLADEPEDFQFPVGKICN